MRFERKMAVNKSGGMNDSGVDGKRV